VARAQLLGAGDRAGITESALVLDDTRPLVDLGDDTGLSPGDAVYAGRVVIGKIAEVGRFSSTLRMVTDSEYSGRARLARRTSQGLVFGAEGTLVGDGSDLCRLKHISDPVNVGDEVVTGGTDGRFPCHVLRHCGARSTGPGSTRMDDLGSTGCSDRATRKRSHSAPRPQPDRILAN